MKKTISMIVTFLLMLLTLSSCYVGDGWQDTPEKALAIEADMNSDNLQRLTSTTILDEFKINDKTYMLFVSKGDTLVQANFVINEEELYHYEGDTEEIVIGEPDTMILNGDNKQFILFNYFSNGTCVWGYKYSSVGITVNGTIPQIKTYTFACEGKEWSIDRWWIEIADANTEINIEYTGDN